MVTFFFFFGGGGGLYFVDYWSFSSFVIKIIKRELTSLQSSSFDLFKPLMQAIFKDKFYVVYLPINSSVSESCTCKQTHFIIHVFCENQENALLKETMLFPKPAAKNDLTEKSDMSKMFGCF